MTCAKKCGTPGCTFRDFHFGLHSTQSCSRLRGHVIDYTESRRKLKPSTPKRKKRSHVAVNQFQLGFELAREVIKQSQIGVHLILSTSSLNGFDGWQDYDAHFAATIQMSNGDGRFVATAIDKDGFEITLTPDILMLSCTYVKWNPIPAIFYTQWKQMLDCEEHKNATNRATFIAQLALEFGTSADDYHLILDGRGNNRVAMKSVYTQLSLDKHPHLMTLEMSPIVAFTQRLMFGDEVVFTGANPEFTTKDLVEGHISHPKIEHLILKDNSILTNNIKEHVKVLYLDYCGGPIANQTPEKCSAYMLDIIRKLPALEIFAVTISRRRHANLDDNFSSYVSTPPGFRLSKTFTDNRRVVCNVYTVLRAEECNSESAEDDYIPVNLPTQCAVKRPYMCSICKLPKKGHICKSFQTVTKRTYMCSKCGKPKKGHICKTRL